MKWSETHDFRDHSTECHLLIEPLKQDGNEYQTLSDELFSVLSLLICDYVPS